MRSFVLAGICVVVVRGAALCLLRDTKQAARVKPGPPVAPYGQALALVENVATNSFSCDLRAVREGVARSRPLVGKKHSRRPPPALLPIERKSFRGFSGGTWFGKGSYIFSYEPWWFRCDHDYSCQA